MSNSFKKSDQNKPWAKRALTKTRSKKNIPIVNSFYIFCEGKNTEPEYFLSFSINPETTKVYAKGFGRQKIALVKHVLEDLKNRAYLKGQNNYDKYRQLWIVFDYDWKGEKNECNEYSQAISLALSHGLKVAYSNDAFELWFVLHFQLLQAETHRNELYKLLDKHLTINYEKDGKTEDYSKKIFEILKYRQQTALQNATMLNQMQNGLDLCKQNPITKVHLLVQELNKFSR